MGMRRSNLELNKRLVLRAQLGMSRMPSRCPVVPTCPAAELSKSGIMSLLNQYFKQEMKAHIDGYVKKQFTVSGGGCGSSWLDGLFTGFRSTPPCCGAPGQLRSSPS